MTLHEQIVHAYNNYIIETDTFNKKKIKIAATRARSALNNLGKLLKDRRKEIQEEKNAL
tara:strand:+ start:238 stop:414 length:177 start_codon:yes stop_codon:yes gene_type:complete